MNEQVKSNHPSKGAELTVSVRGYYSICDLLAHLFNQNFKLYRWLSDICIDGFGAKGIRLSIDNNRAERAIKPFVMGRRAWLFSQNAKGAKASAVLYSIVESAKANGLTPYDYLTHLLEQFSKPNPDIEQLLPWNVKLRDGL